MQVDTVNSVYHGPGFRLLMCSAVTDHVHIGTRGIDFFLEEEHGMCERASCCETTSIYCVGAKLTPAFFRSIRILGFPLHPRVYVNTSATGWCVCMLPKAECKSNTTVCCILCWRKTLSTMISSTRMSCHMTSGNEPVTRLTAPNVLLASQCDVYLNAKTRVTADHNTDL